MAIYYVRTDGDNDNAGTGYSTSAAWQTIAKAVSSVSAGDTVYIAPGSYNETVTLATAGGSSTVISWIGDNVSAKFLDVAPGPVRITKCDANGIAQATGYIINTNSKDYNSFYNFVVDGTKTGTTQTIYCTTNTKIYNCIVSGGSNVLYGGYAYNCIVIASSIAYALCTTDHCIAFCGNRGYNVCVATNCISVGGAQGGFYACSSVINCIAYLAGTGFLNGTNITNCIAFGCNIGYSGLNTMIIVKSKAINCNYAVYGTSNTTPVVVSDIKYTQCCYTGRGGGYESGTPIEAIYEGYTDITKYNKILQALKFDIKETEWSTDLASYTFSGITGAEVLANTDYIEAGTYNGQTYYVCHRQLFVLFYSSTLQANNWVLCAGTTANESATNYAYCATITGTYTNAGDFAGTAVCATYTPISFSPNTDILGNPRRMGGGLLDCGAIEYSTLNFNRTTSPNQIEITKQGLHYVVIPVEIGVTYNVYCDVSFDLDGGSNKPQLILEDLPNTTCLSASVTTTATGSGSNETITASCTPIASGFIRITLYNRETGSGSYAYFSNIKY